MTRIPERHLFLPKHKRKECRSREKRNSVVRSKIEKNSAPASQQERRGCPSHDCKQTLRRKPRPPPNEERSPATRGRGGASTKTRRDPRSSFFSVCFPTGWSMAAVRDGLSFSIEKILSPDFGHHRRWAVNKGDCLFYPESITHLHPFESTVRVSSWLEQLKRTKRVLSEEKRVLSTPDESSKRGFFSTPEEKKGFSTPEECSRRWISSTSSECSTPDPIKRPSSNDASSVFGSPDSKTEFSNTPKRPSSNDPPPTLSSSEHPSPKRRISLDKDFFSPLSRCSNHLPSFSSPPPPSYSGSRSPDSERSNPEQKPEVVEKKDNNSNNKREEGAALEKKNNSDTSAMGSGKDLLLNGSDKWPVWVYCNRYSPRPSSGPRSRRQSRKSSSSSSAAAADAAAAEKRCRTAFSGAQLSRLREEFQSSPYLSESRRSSLAAALQLSEAQVKIWFQNMRAKLKRSCREKDPLAMKLMEQGLYNHSTNKE